MQEGKSCMQGGYMQVCNKGSGQSEYQRSSIKLSNSVYGKMRASGVTEFICISAIWGESCFLVYLTSSIPQLLSNHPESCQHLQAHSFGNPHTHLEARNHWSLWHFLFINMAGGIFISQEVILGLVFFFFFKEILMLLCIFPVPIYIPMKREGGFFFLWALCGT